jgi:alkanesulfonate monooxygenase SsuD/methylene tetrahydromethanopterin reductase-like flavin-dependent oxidoreductase (luciferase family)
MAYEHNGLGIPFPESSERWARFEEALAYLNAAFSDGTASYEGNYYQLHAQVRPKPKGLRLILGGSGAKRTPTLAGTTADEYNFFMCPPDEAKSKVDVMREAAGGRRVEATVMGSVLVGRDDSDYRRKRDEAALQRGTSPEELERRWTDNGTVFGPPGKVAESIAALEEAGVNRIYIQWLDLDDIDGLKSAFEVVLS